MGLIIEFFGQNFKKFFSENVILLCFSTSWIRIWHPFFDLTLLNQDMPTFPVKMSTFSTIVFISINVISTCFSTCKHWSDIYFHTDAFIHQYMRLLPDEKIKFFSLFGLIFKFLFYYKNDTENKDYNSWPRWGFTKYGCDKSSMDFRTTVNKN